ncbi:MAG TPA: Flp pilus assembly protein CpaB [Gemmatimonadales bacterium]
MAVRTRSLVLLFLALASGGAAAWLSLGYLRRQTQPLLSAGSVSGKAVVAAKDLPVGTVVTENDVRLVDWPGNALPPGLISSPQDAIGRGVLSGVRLNEPFLETKLAPRGTGGGMPVLITDKMRAMSIRVDDVIGVAGFVLPGTRVDVLLTVPGAPVASEPTTKALLQNIQALAAAQSFQVDAQGKAQPVPVVTLLVTPEQAETLAMAAHQGRIQLTMRNILDTTLIRTTGARASSLFGPGRPVQGPLVQGYRRVPSVSAPRQSANEETIIEQFRGGERSLIRFSRPRQPDRDTAPETRENR